MLVLAGVVASVLVIWWAVASGAGSGASLEDDDDATMVAESFPHRLARGDGRGACALLTARAQRELVKQLGVPGMVEGGHHAECTVTLEVLAESYGPAERRGLAGVRVVHISVDGGRASIADADVRYPAGSEHMGSEDDEPMVLARTARGWLIDDLG